MEKLSPYVSHPHFTYTPAPQQNYLNHDLHANILGSAFPFFSLSHLKVHVWFSSRFVSTHIISLPGRFHQEAAHCGGKYVGLTSTTLHFKSWNPDPEHSVFVSYARFPHLRMAWKSCSYKRKDLLLVGSFIVPFCHLYSELIDLLYFSLHILYEGDTKSLSSTPFSTQIIILWKCC